MSAVLKWQAPQIWADSVSWPLPLSSRRLGFHVGPLPGEPTDGLFANVAGARVHYLDRGAGPAVVLLHGFTSSVEIWRNLIPELAREHRVVAPDLKGFGWTDRPDGDYSPRAQAAVVWALLDHLGLEEVALVAHSWGASVALAMALSAGERTTRIAIYDGWIYEEQLSFLFRWSRVNGVGEWLFRLYDEAWARSHLALGFHDLRHVTPELVKSLQSRMARPGARAAALATMRGMHFIEQEKLYPTLQIPALILWGQEDSISGPAFGRRLADELSAELLFLPGCGHFPMIEASQRSNDTLQHFLGSST
jgi:pimeloyl-ACP methyl ester carboxylesterase